MTDGDKLKDVIDEYRKVRQKAVDRISKAIEQDRQDRREQTE